SWHSQTAPESPRDMRSCARRCRERAARGGGCRRARMKGGRDSWRLRFRDAVEARLGKSGSAAVRLRQRFDQEPASLACVLLIQRGAHVLRQPVEPTHVIHPISNAAVLAGLINITASRATSP